MDLRFPNITAGTEQEQIEQIKSYLYQLVGQLEWIFSSMGKGSSETSGTDVSAIVSAVKPLLIQASEIVSAYYEQMKPSIERDFCTKQEIEDTKKEISALEKRIESGAEITDRFKFLHYVPFLISGTEIKISTKGMEQSIFIFGGGIYGNIFITVDGNVGFSGSEGVSSVTYADGVFTVKLSEKADTVFSAFSAHEFEIL